MTRAGQSWLEVDFAWVIDPKLRGILERFHSEAVAAFGEKHYVSAVVLSGSVLEGLLTFALARRELEADERYRKLKTRERVPRLSEWPLNDLIVVAHDMRLVGEGPAKAAQAVRDFRNLIHPYRLLRRSNPRWDALAAMALGAVAEVSRSLSGRM